MTQSHMLLGCQQMLSTRPQATLLCCSICVWIDLNDCMRTLCGKCNCMHFTVFGRVLSPLHRLRHRILSESQKPCANNRTVSGEQTVSTKDLDDRTTQCSTAAIVAYLSVLLNTREILTSRFLSMLTDLEEQHVV